MAEVFLARQEGIAGFRRLAVIKKILPQLSQVKNVSEMLLDEARIAAQLNHPNIVQIYELGQEGDQYFIAMEFVDGCDLATLARIERHRKGRIPLRLTLRTVSEAAMGLDYAHRQMGMDGRPLNVVHRDVSPHNIMCSREGMVKVTDFGIAKAVGKGQVTQVGVVKGKVHYMSPEQYTGGEVDHRSDIFSLGVVLYQLTVGRLPRVSENGEMVIRRVLEGKIPPPSEIRPDYPDELEAIVMRALAQNPEERYPDAASMRGELLDFARENDLLAFPNELGAYVDELVPAKPLVVREQSMVSVEADGGAGAQVEEELETADRPETEAVSLAERVQSAKIVTNARSDPFGFTEIPIDAASRDDLVSEPAVLPEEHLTASAISQVSPGRGALGASLASAPVVASNQHAGQAEEPLKTPTPSSPEGSPPPPAPPTAPPPLSLKWIASLLGAFALGGALFFFWMGSPWGDKRGEDPVQAGAGVINVLANPNTSSVSIDGAQRCPATPCQIAGLPLGREILITLRATGYTLWMQRIVLTKSDPKLLLRADLAPELKTQPLPPKPEQPPASQKRAGGSSKASVRKQPSKVGVKPKATKGTASSHTPCQMAVTDIEGDQAILVVDARPWAEIWINGQKVGVTPFQRAVPVGSFKVELKNPELKYAKSCPVQAQKGKKVKILEAIPAPQASPTPAK